jgi:hypothetical protein
VFSDIDIDYCVNDGFYNRFHCISVAKEMAQGLQFSHVELKICKFHGAYDCYCFNTQVYTGFSESLIKCLALTLSAYNFWENYALKVYSGLARSVINACDLVLVIAY